jgi:hypothetical protein
LNRFTRIETRICFGLSARIRIIRVDRLLLAVVFLNDLASPYPERSNQRKPQKTRKPRESTQGFRGFSCGRGRDFVPRSPSLELYVLPNGGGQLLYDLLHPQSQQVAI